MDWIALHELLGRARGVLEAQPVGPPKQRATMEAYRRYAARGVEGFASWDLPPAQVRRFVSSAVRAVTLERLAEAADELEAALAARDRAMAMRAGQTVQECLDVLRQHPAVRRGRRAVVMSEPKLRQTLAVT
jgi:hypothetical protein